MTAASADKPAACPSGETGLPPNAGLLLPPPPEAGLPCAAAREPNAAAGGAPKVVGCGDPNAGAFDGEPNDAVVEGNPNRGAGS